MKEKKQRYVVVVDSGKSATKTVAGVFGQEIDSRKKFFTRMSPTTELTSNSSSSYVFKFDEERVLLGASESLISTQTTKSTDLHKYCTYASIGIHGIPSGSEIILGVGCPLSEFLNTKRREEYIRFMLGLDEKAKVNLSKLDIEIEYTLNNKKLSYTIVEFHVFPETSGATNYEYLLDEDPKFAIVDIGGLNVNGAIYSDGPDGVEITKAITLEHGGNMFLINLKQEIFKEFDNLDLDEEQVLSALKRGSIRRSGRDIEGSSEFLKKKTAEYLDRIKKDMRGNQWSLDAYPYVFIGGGSQIYKNAILETPEWENAIISDNPVWENVEGFGYLCGLVEPEEEEVGV